MKDKVSVPSVLQLSKTCLNSKRSQLIFYMHITFSVCIYISIEHTDIYFIVYKCINVNTLITTG